MNSYKKEDKGKKKWTFGEDLFLDSRTTKTSQTKEGRSFFRERKRERERERDLEIEGKNY